MTQSTRVRIALYSLLALSALQTWGLVLQAKWIREQRAVIQQLWQDRQPRSRGRNPAPPLVRTAEKMGEKI